MPHSNTKEVCKSAEKTVEESFLMVAGTVVAGRIDSSVDQLNLPQGITKHDVDERFQQLAMVLEIASGETKVYLNCSRSTEVCAG